ncbi:MAG: zinc ribbon domain-containing protein, partial [Candidatus Caldatribacteriaceae bacterium]
GFEFGIVAKKGTDLKTQCQRLKNGPRLKPPFDILPGKWYYKTTGALGIPEKGQKAHLKLEVLSKEGSAMLAQPQGPFCQSCAMPMVKPEDFGTNADGSPNGEYCRYCFQNGEFTAPDTTVE